MPIIESIKKCFSKYSAFSGESTRIEFWPFALLFCVTTSVLVIVIAYLVSLSISYQVSGTPEYVVTGINLSIYTYAVVFIATTICTALSIPFLAAGSRRLHNIGMNGKWQLLLLTQIGTIWLIIWWSLKSPASYSFRQSLKLCWSKYFKFSGRAPNSEFWWFLLFTVIATELLSYVYINVAALLYNIAINGSQIYLNLIMFWNIITFVIVILLILPLLSVGSRRLHDSNKSGWWQLLLVTGIGALPMLLLWSRNSESNFNNFDQMLSQRYSPIQDNACNNCGNELATGAQFCTNCGSNQTTPSNACNNCGNELATGAQFCTNCGSNQTTPSNACNNCGNELATGIKFCAECGNSVS